MSGSAFISAIVRPAKVTANASCRSPVPPHTGHGPDFTKCSTLARIVWLEESARMWRTYFRALQKRPLYGLATRSRCGVICTTGCSSVNKSQSRSFLGSSRHGRSTS